MLAEVILGELADFRGGPAVQRDIECTGSWETGRETGHSWEAVGSVSAGKLCSTELVIWRKKV